MAAACRDVEAATLAHDGSPPITRTTFPTCRAHYPGGSSGCSCRLLPRSCSLPPLTGGSASALALSRPSQASLTLRPIGSLNRPRRPLSRGSGPSGYPAEPLVSYRINRQLSGWNLPPLVIRAFGAHGQNLPRCSVLVCLLPPGADIVSREEIRWSSRAVLLRSRASARSSFSVPSGRPRVSKFRKSITDVISPSDCAFSAYCPQRAWTGSDQQTQAFRDGKAIEWNIAVQPPC